MRTLWIGYGQAGGKIANTLMGMRKSCYSAIAVNTEEADLAGLNKVDRRILIGWYKQRGRGVGADLELSGEIAQKSLSQTMGWVGKLTEKLDPEAYWILAGTAGGTGAGGAYVLANELKSIYDKPVYALAILPSTTGLLEEKEALCIQNTLKSIELWNKYFDNILLLDNPQYERREETTESVERMYRRINRDVARKLTILLCAGEAKYPPQEVFSASEIKATLGKGGGFSTLGYRGERIKRLTRFWATGINPDERRLEEIIKDAVDRSRLTFACDVSGAKAGGMVAYGRPQHLFTQAITTGKAHLEKLLKVGEIRYGDYPDKWAGELGAVVLASGISDFPRLDEMRKRLAEIG
ncbi:MAG: hypothetical protein R6U89_05880 [Dehalococcoidia bacterium]